MSRFSKGSARSFSFGSSPISASLRVVLCFSLQPSFSTTTFLFLKYFCIYFFLTFICISSINVKFSCIFTPHFSRPVYDNVSDSFRRSTYCFPIFPKFLSSRNFSIDYSADLEWSFPIWRSFFRIIRLRLGDLMLPRSSRRS